MATNLHYASCNIPLPLRPALFLDIDGTIAPIAATPGEASIPQHVLNTLNTLQTDLSGAIALISGRTVKSIDSLTMPHSFHAAGQHGLEIRLINHQISRATEQNELIKQVAHEVAPLQRLYPALHIELKELSIALHYRAAPSLKDTVTRYLEETIEPHMESLQLQHGKMVCEVRLKGMNKGDAIDALLATPLFHDRTPIFIGDDLTDEDGFKAVNAHGGGISIKIGEGDTVARYQLPNTDALSYWLENLQRVVSHG